LAYYQPTGVACHPFDWEDLELEVDNNGAYTIAISVAVGGQKQLWRLNLVDTPAIMQGQFILGAYGLAAKLWDREQVSIQVSTENRDMFERNVVTLRCEERVALEVPRPEAMVIGTFTTPTS
jgi:HK97 family phage major capsid protein